MVVLRSQLYDEVFEILFPFMQTLDLRRSILIPLLQGTPTYQHVKWEGSGFEVTVHIIDLLSKDELIALLKRLTLGEEKKETIELLCSQIRLQLDEGPRPIEKPSLLRDRHAFMSPPIFTLAIFFGFTAAWLFGPQELSGPFALSVALASLIFLLFRLAEYDFKPELKSLAARWLLENGNAKDVNTARAFSQAFNAVFDAHHFTAKSFTRSTIISTFFLTTLLLLAVYVLDLEVIRASNEWLTLALFGFIANVLGDYIVVLKTRVLLHWYERHQAAYLILLVDIISTLVIFFAFIACAISLLYFMHFLQNLQNVKASDVWGKAVSAFAGIVRQFYIEVTGHNSQNVLTSPDRVLLYCALLTTFMSSLWLWLSLLLGPIVRYLIKTRANALSLIGFFFEVDRYPFTAMGYLSATVILCLGIMTWGIGFAFTSI